MRAERPGRLPGDVEPGRGRRLRHRLRANLGRSGAFSASRSLPSATTAPSLVDHPERRPQVVGDLGPVPRLRAARARRSSRAGTAPARRAAAPPRRRGGEELARDVGRRHEVDPQLLGQRPDQRGHQLLAQPRHLPGERVGVDLVERGQRHVDGDAVGGRARLELVAQRQRQVALAPLVGVVLRGDSSAPLVTSIAGSKVSRSGSPSAGLLPPGVEVRARTPRRAPTRAS